MKALMRSRKALKSPNYTLTQLCINSFQWKLHYKTERNLEQKTKVSKRALLHILMAVASMFL